MLTRPKWFWWRRVERHLQAALAALALLLGAVGVWLHILWSGATLGQKISMCVLAGAFLALAGMGLFWWIYD